MAVIDHMRVASAELMKAAELVKQEIESLRKEETTSLQAMDAKIAEHLRQIQSLEYGVHHVGDSRQSSQMRAIVARMQREVADMRAEIRERQRNMEDAIRQKSGMVSGLESQARSIAP